MGLIALPYTHAPYSVFSDAIQACIILIVATSLVLLTGWVGQISLAQATFVGFGAFATGLFSRAWHVPFPISLPLAALVSAAGAAVLGVVALRVRGLYLAVATLIFAWMSDRYLFQASWLAGVGGSSAIKVPQIGRPGTFPFFDLSDRHTMYVVCIAVAAAILGLVANLRDSRTGRAFFAVRGSEMAAASLGINVTRHKLLAFSIAGFLAGVAGNLLMTSQGAAVPAQFSFLQSIFYLAVAVVGGQGSLGGAVAASILFAGLQELFFDVAALAGWLEIVSATMLAVVLKAYPGGLAAFPAGIAARRNARSRDSSVEAVEETPNERTPADFTLDRALSLRDGTDATRADRQSLRPCLEVEGLIVQFGGLRAVDDVSLSVRVGEIVGLIGPNGAGKTTVFNAISGLNQPASGSIRLLDQDLTRMPAHERAARGLARTFQVIQLFNQLTVFDNLMVAAHLQIHTGLFSHVFATKPALVAEKAARDRVREIMGLLNLQDRPIAGLPFGSLRLVELARAVVTGAPLIMLDEPASGLDNNETDRMTEFIFYIRERFGTSILLIEHDVRMVVGVSDYVYVVNRGRMLAQGTPAQIQRDENVIASYLGTSVDQETSDQRETLTVPGRTELLGAPPR